MSFNLKYKLNLNKLLNVYMLIITSYKKCFYDKT